MKASNNTLLPVLALIVSTIGAASAIAFVKVSEVDATSTLMLRMFFAGGLTYAIAAWPLKNSQEIEKNNPMSKGATMGLLILSSVVSTIDLLSAHWAVELTSIANTAILMNLSPIFVALLSYLFLNKKIGLYKLQALGLSIIGACFLVFDDNAMVEFSVQSMIGDLLAVNSALFYAIYLLLLKSLRDYLSSHQIIIWNSLTCALLLVPVALISSSQILPTTLEGWIVIALLALISQLLGHGLMAYALKHVDVTLACISTLARPVVAILIGFFLFDEKLALSQCVGVVTVLAGIWLYSHLMAET